MGSRRKLVHFIPAVEGADRLIYYFLKSFLPDFGALLVPHQLPHINNHNVHVGDGKLVIRHPTDCSDRAVRHLEPKQMQIHKI